MKYMNPISGSHNLHESYGFNWSFIDQNPENADQLKKHVLDQDQRSNFPGCSQSTMHPFNNMLKCSMKLPAAATVDLHPGNELFPHLSTTNMEDTPCPSMLKSQPLLFQNEILKSKGDDNCKLFGISLISNHKATEPAMLHADFMHRPQRQIACSSYQLQDLVSNLQSQQAECAKPAEITIRDDEWGKPFQALEQLSRNFHGRLQGSSTRTCIKVFSYPFKFILNYVSLFKRRNSNLLSVNIYKNRFISKGMQLGGLWNLLSLMATMN